MPVENLGGIRISGGGIGALPGSYPISVYVENVVRANQVTFTYQGPAGVLYLCWGLKAGTGDFNNGANLEGGMWTSTPIYVMESLTPTQFPVYNISADLLITANMRTGRTYDTYIWFSTNNSTQEANMLKRLGASERLIDTDSGIVKINSELAAGSLSVGYIGV